MVWGAIADASRFLLVFIQGNITVLRYFKKIVQPYVSPHLKGLENPIFQLESDRPPVATISSNFFQRDTYQSFAIVPKSPLFHPQSMFGTSRCMEGLAYRSHHNFWQLYEGDFVKYLSKMDRSFSCNIDKTCWRVYRQSRWTSK